MMPAQLENKCADQAACAWLVAPQKLEVENGEIRSLVDKGAYKDADLRADDLLNFAEKHWGSGSPYTAFALDIRAGVGVHPDFPPFISRDRGCFRPHGAVAFPVL